MPVERRSRLRTIDLTAVAVEGGRPQPVGPHSDATISTTISTGTPLVRRTEDCSVSLHTPRDDGRGSGLGVRRPLIIQPG